MNLLKNKQSRLLAIMMVAFSLTYADMTIFSVALPTIQKAFNATNMQAFWVMNAYILVRAILVFASGKLSDIFGHRRSFIFGLFILLVSSFGCAFSSTIYTLIVFRCLQGIGATFIFVPGMSIVTSEFPKESRGKIISMLLSAGLISMAIGPVVGGLFIEYLTWKWIFYINVVVSLFTIIMIIPYIKDTEKKAAQGKFDWLGFMTSAIFALCLNIAFQNSVTWGWGSRRFIITIVIACIAVLAFLFIESKKSEPLVDLSLFSLPNFLPGCLIASFVQISVWMLVFLGIFLQNALGYSPAAAGYLLLPMIIVGVIFSNIGGYWVDKYGVKLPLVIGTGSLATGFITTLFLYSGVSYIKLLPLMLLSGVGMFMISGPIRTCMLDYAPHNKHGMVNAVLTGIRSIFSVIGFALITAIITNVEFITAKVSLLKKIPSMTTNQVHMLLGVLSHTPASHSILAQYDNNMQDTIYQLILKSYIHGFFWVLVFMSVLMVVTFLMSVLCIKRRT